MKVDGATAANVAKISSRSRNQNYKNTPYSKDNKHSDMRKEDTCKFCGHDNHPRQKCPARNSTCHKCNKRGHYGRVCLSKSASKVKEVTHEDTDDSDESDYYVASEVTSDKS